MHTRPTNQFRCDLCHRPVDADTRARARRAWQPLIICEHCIRDAEASFTSRQPVAIAA